jgi:hypothetical protein
MNAIDLTAQFIANITWDKLPEPVQRKAWMCLVDNLGGNADDLARKLGHFFGVAARACVDDGGTRVEGG